MKNKEINTVGQWTAPDQIPELKAGTIDVWKLKLENFTTIETDLLKLLSTKERQKSTEFYFPVDRQRSVIGRGVLRFLLGKYLNKLPTELSFGYGNSGKPFLKDSVTEIHFNLSHSGNWIIIGLSASGTLGVDVEPVSEKINVQTLASRFFSRKEVPGLLALPAAEQKAAFFRLWTRKEAIIKARGDGLGCPLDQFGVEMANVEAVRVLHTDWDIFEADHWQLRSFFVDQHKQVPAAMATLFPFKELRLLEVTPELLLLQS